jgi:hypothetical protein
MALLFQRVEDPDAICSLSIDNCNLVVDLYSRLRREPQLKISQTSGVIRLTLPDGSHLPALKPVSEVVHAMNQNKAFQNRVIVTVKDEISTGNVEIPADKEASSTLELHSEVRQEKLLSKLKTVITQSDVSLICSPPGSGKTFLLNKLQYEFRNSQTIYVSCKKPFNCDEFLQGKMVDSNGIEYYLKEIKKEYIIIILDDVQEIYKRKYFWLRFFKLYLTYFQDENIRFVLSASHNVDPGYESPEDFINLFGLRREDFLLSEAESRSFLIEATNGLLDENLILSIISQAGGLIGTLKMVADSFNNRFSKIKGSTKQKFDYLMSPELTLKLDRCFGKLANYPVSQDVLDVLRKCLLSSDQVDYPQIDNQNRKTLTRLEICGVIVVDHDKELFEFSSLFAKRYYMKALFPYRSTTDPQSLNELVLKAVQNMSSCAKSKEVPWKSLFLEVLCNSMSPQTEIIPHISECLGLKTPKKSDLDLLLISRKFKWRLQVFFNFESFPKPSILPEGKYSLLNLSDSVVLEFRQDDLTEQTRKKLFRHKQKITIFMNEELSECTCVLGLNSENIVLKLTS